MKRKINKKKRKESSILNRDRYLFIKNERIKNSS